MIKAKELTREQKIDFLKCCIAAYEDPRIQSRIGQYRISQYEGLPITGLCRMLDHYCQISGILRTGYCVLFPEFYSSIIEVNNNFFKWPLTKVGCIQRANFCRDFLLINYGIAVKRKTLC